MEPSEFEKLAMRYKAMRFLVECEPSFYGMTKEQRIAAIYNLIQNSEWYDDKLVLPCPVLYDFDLYTDAQYFVTDFMYKNNVPVLMGYMKTKSNNYIGLSERI